MTDTKPISEDAKEGIVRLLVALHDVPVDARLDAVAAFCNIAIQTDWLTHDYRKMPPRRVRTCV